MVKYKAQKELLIQLLAMWCFLASHALRVCVRLMESNVDGGGLC